MSRDIDRASIPETPFKEVDVTPLETVPYLSRDGAPSSSPNTGSEADLEKKETRTSSPVDGVSAGSDSGLAAAAPRLLPIPWQYKWLALLCACAFPIGLNCGVLSPEGIQYQLLMPHLCVVSPGTDSALGPLKNTLRNELGINNAQYGVIDA